MNADRKQPFPTKPNLSGFESFLKECLDKTKIITLYKEKYLSISYIHKLFLQIAKLILINVLSQAKLLAIDTKLQIAIYFHLPGLRIL